MFTSETNRRRISVKLCVVDTRLEVKRSFIQNVQLKVEPTTIACGNSSEIRETISDIADDSHGMSVGRFAVSGSP
jgi:hypothetical protein